MNQYQRGYRAELALVKLLKQREEFHTVIRSAGSRSPFDVVAIGEDQFLLCQVKTGTGSFRGEIKKLKLLPVPGCTRIQVWLYRRGRWVIIEVNQKAEVPLIERPRERRALRIEPVKDSARGFPGRAGAAE